MFKGRDGPGLRRLVPRVPRWFAARLRLPPGVLPNILLRHCLLIAVECAEIVGGGPHCFLDHSLVARFGCDESPMQ